MTGVRESFIFALEDDYGKGKGNNNEWIAPPVGSFFNSTHSRQVTKIYTVGSKFFDTVAYGQMNGAFNWTFNFDYYYLEPLQLAFEKVGCKLDTDGVHYVHTFEKINNGRVPSFTVRRKILNRVAGGPDYSDEITELRGCVVRNISFSKAAGTSQLQVTLTGFYADEVMYKGELDATDYKPYDGQLSEYMCMFVGTPEDDDSYVANTESLEFSIENNSDAVYNTCSPFAGIYYEGRTNCTFGTTCYSNNPSHYKQRVYSGGFKNDVLKPMAKGLKPIPVVTLVAYDKSIHDDELIAEGDFATAINKSDETMTITLDEVVIKSLTWPKGNDQKLQDTISSAECRSAVITITNLVDDTTTEGNMIYDDKNVVTSLGYGIILKDVEGKKFTPNALISRTEDGVQVIRGLPILPGGESNTSPWFLGWYAKPANDSGEGSQMTNGMTIGSNQTLYSRWKHTVTFVTSASGIQPTATNNEATGKIYPHGTAGQSGHCAPDTAKTGYTFDGWYTAETGGDKFPVPTGVIVKDQSVYSRYTAIVYTITIDKNGGTTNGSAKAAYDATKMTDIELPTREGYTFAGYYKEAGLTNAIASADGTFAGTVEGYVTDGKWTATENKTLYAKWTQNQE